MDDFDDFPITFKQGTHRLIYCIQKLQLLRQRKGIKFNHVEIRSIFKAIERSIRKVFGFFKSKHLTIRKYIRCILNDEEYFNLLDNYLNKNNYFRKEEAG